MRYNTWIIFLFFGMMAFVNCSKECDINNPTCSETPPTDELCFAAFNNWFYNKKSNKCEQIAYSGCSSQGFTTQEECETCKCK